MEASNARQGQEGSRWINYRPSGEEVAEWFEKNVTIAEGLDHKDYVSGITLIVQDSKEKAVVDFTDQGKPVIDEVTNLHYVPYAKVETRVKYFNDLMNKHEGQWLGLIETVPPPEPTPGLPEGFYRMVVADAQGKNVAFVCCSMRVSVYERDTVGWELFKPKTGKIERVRTGKLVLQGAVGSKMVPVLGRYGPDPNALMKAETGAVGRALGLAGMLVVPGSGVATAEDVHEAQALEGGPVQAAPPTAEEAALPADTGDDAMRQMVAERVDQLEKLDTERLKKFRAWCAERKFGKLSEAQGPQLRGILRRLDKDIAEAQAEVEGAGGS